jgi:chromosome segregation ATPase
MTQAGTRHAKGSLEGGWRPQRKEDSCSLALEAQMAAADAAAAEMQLSIVMQQQAAASAALHAAEEQERQLTELQDQLQRVQARLSSHTCKQKQLEASLVATQTRLRELEALIGDSRKTPLQDNDRGSINKECLEESAAVANRRLADARAHVDSLQQALEVTIKPSYRLQPSGAPYCNIVGAAGSQGAGRRAAESVGECGHGCLGMQY